MEEILLHVRAGEDVCVAFYGHPGVFVLPSHAAISRAREEGLPARMLPAVSAEDCLFADLGLDPAGGCQSYEATDFVLRPRAVDPSALLLLWQVGAVGVRDARAPDRNPALRLVAEELGRHYPADHEAVLYVAAPFEIVAHRGDPVRIGDLGEADVDPMATLVVPPLAAAAEPDPERLERLRSLFEETEEV